MTEPNWSWRTQPRRGGVAVQLLAPLDASAERAVSLLVQRTVDAAALYNEATAAHALAQLLPAMREEAQRRLVMLRASPRPLFAYGGAP
jgi:hypothetical protein